MLQIALKALFSPPKFKGAPVATFRAQDSGIEDPMLGSQLILEGIMASLGMFCSVPNIPTDYLKKTTTHRECYVLALMYWKLELGQDKKPEGKVLVLLLL